MKYIGIVTSAKELNYGAILQAYALQTVVERMGFDAELLWWSNQKERHHDIRVKKFVGMMIRYVLHPSIFIKSVRSYQEAFKKDFTEEAVSHFKEFEIKKLHINYMNYHEMKKYAFKDDCVAVIAGSDQIWNSYSVYMDPFYYLRFVPKKKRIAYAPSLGKNDIPNYNKSIMKKYVQDIPFLSIREESGRKLLKELVQREIEVVLDPSLLLTKEEWKEIETCITVPNKYILFYFLDEPDETGIKLLQFLMKRKESKVIAFPYHFSAFSKIGNVEFIEPGPAEFIKLVDNADLIITDSFHGTALSLVLEKEFFTFARQYGSNQSQSSRIEGILADFGLRERYMNKFNHEYDFDQRIDYESVRLILREKRKSSMEYLNSAIKGVET